MTITDGERLFSFTIVDYQYPEAKPSTKMRHNTDANWLVIQISFKQGDDMFEHYDPCMETDDLTRLRNKMDLMLAGSSSCHIFEFTEPYIKFAIAAVGGGYVFMIQHCDTDESGKWVTRATAEMMDRSRFQEVRDEIAELCEKFPVR